MDKANLIAQSYPFAPTQEQLQFCEQVYRFLTKKQENRCFVLRGYAGTGKTTSVAALVKALPHFRLNVVLMAPTGRAAKVISSYTGKRALTIHKNNYSHYLPTKTSNLAPQDPTLFYDYLFL